MQQLQALRTVSVETVLGMQGNVVSRRVKKCAPHTAASMQWSCQAGKEKTKERSRVPRGQLHLLLLSTAEADRVNDIQKQLYYLQSDPDWHVCEQTVWINIPNWPVHG